MIVFEKARSDQELRQILALQSQNLARHISQEEALEQGFVSVHHSFELLKAMNTPYPHSVAKDGGRVVGYALVMTRAFEQDIPILKPMFERINVHNYGGTSLAQTPYVIMGQVCIDKAYRGKGIFAGLYHHMRDHLSPYFPCMITEVAARNGRSARAHEKVGFQLLHAYTSEEGQDWRIILWDWS